MHPATRASARSGPARPRALLARQRSPACPPSLRSGFRSAPARPPPSGGLAEDPYRPVNATLDTAPRRWNIAGLLILDEPPSAMPTVTPCLPEPRLHNRARTGDRDPVQAKMHERIPLRAQTNPAPCLENEPERPPITATAPTISGRHEPTRASARSRRTSPQTGAAPRKNARTNSFPWDRTEPEPPTTTTASTRPDEPEPPPQPNTSDQTNPETQPISRTCHFGPLPSLRSGFGPRAAPAPPSRRLPQDRYRFVNAAFDTAGSPWPDARRIVL